MVAASLLCFALVLVWFGLAGLDWIEVVGINEARVGVKERREGGKEGREEGLCVYVYVCRLG